VRRLNELVVADDARLAGRRRPNYVRGLQGDRDSSSLWLGGR